MSHNCRLFEFLSYNCLLIIISCVKPYNCVQTNDYYWISKVTLNYIIIKVEYLKPYNCVQLFASDKKSWDHITEYKKFLLYRGKEEIHSEIKS